MEILSGAEPDADKVCRLDGKFIAFFIASGNLVYLAGVVLAFGVYENTDRAGLVVIVALLNGKEASVVGGEFSTGV